MTHPPGEVLRAYAAGATELTRRLLVEAHLTLCRECFALVPQYRDPRDRLPEATITDEVQMPGFERVWYAVERAGEAKVCPQAATVLPGPFSALSLVLLPEQHLSPSSSRRTRGERNPLRRLSERRCSRRGGRLGDWRAGYGACADDQSR